MNIMSNIVKNFNEKIMFFLKILYINISNKSNARKIIK